jgi:hypothetical protein
VRVCACENSFFLQTIYVRMALRDKDTLALSTSSTTEDVVINSLMQKRREFLSASKFVSQLPSHSWSKKMPYCLLIIK